jgi:hypothetical protein
LNFDEYRNKYDLEEIYSRLASTNFDTDELDKMSLDPKFKFEIKRFINAMIFWELVPGEKGICKEEVIRNSLLLGPDYARELSDKWEFGLRSTMNYSVAGRRYENWEKVTNYNYFPQVCYLIHWEEIPNDIEYMKLPLLPFKEEYIEEFKEILFDLLPDEITPPSDIDVLSFTKTSSSYSFIDGKSIPMYKARMQPEGSQFSEVFKASRSIVPIAAMNTRDAVVTSIDTFNSMKWCDLVTLEILNELRTSLVNSSSKVFLRRLHGITKSRQGKSIFFMRDIKKAGLTFPRELFQTVQEVLSEKYPDKDFSRFNIYRNYSIYENSKPIETVRGYCLGMANNLVTLC